MLFILENFRGQEIFGKYLWIKPGHPRINEQLVRGFFFDPDCNTLLQGAK